MSLKRVKSPSSGVDEGYERAKKKNSSLTFVEYDAAIRNPQNAVVFKKKNSNTKYDNKIMIQITWTNPSHALVEL